MVEEEAEEEENRGSETRKEGCNKMEGTSRCFLTLNSHSMVFVCEAGTLFMMSNNVAESRRIPWHGIKG
jgi:hypothetical protein